MKQFDIVCVPFPFTDKLAVKVRPALLISSDDNFNNKSGRLVMAMITSSRQKTWPLDTEILRFKEAGLNRPCFIRMKIFTLDRDIIIKKVGRLEKTDMLAAKLTISSLFN